LGFAIFAALSLQQATRTGAQEQPRPATAINTTATNTTVTTIDTAVDTTNTVAGVSYLVGYAASPIRARSHEMDFGGPDPSPQESATAGLSEGTQSHCSVSIL